MGDVVLRAAPVVAAGGVPLRPGDDVVVRFRVHAERGLSDELVAVYSDEVRRVELRWDRDCDGVAEPVATLPLEHGVVPSGRGVGADYRLVLVGLREEHTVGSTVVVKFDFALAGELTVAVPVAQMAVNSGSCFDAGVV
ncbi:hypothetical protein ADK67_32650 [Saccharothrix sp. NRRL B-16348]|uniref:hypothetical protein n=1 Tax=Saccharothrix sp. NRRL B-16348 TaxID=1415542 RepID=UPI0006B00D4B|nr:hypothetical protein [Saccharothrix sp. NRRL B-16348]KOX19697.1 hypothetical protein ADK67_32650 [Saccharothrix sp. NRRL B-16348]